MCITYSRRRLILGLVLLQFTRERHCYGAARDTRYTLCMHKFSSLFNKKHLKNVGPIRHNEPPHALSPISRSFPLAAFTAAPLYSPPLLVVPFDPVTKLALSLHILPLYSLLQPFLPISFVFPFVNFSIISPFCSLEEFTEVQSKPVSLILSVTNTNLLCLKLFLCCGK